MNNGFTYEFNNINTKLETYEWDNIWWEHANSDTIERVLVIGDSISCGYRGEMNKILEGAVYVDGLGTSKAIDNPCFIKAIDYVLSQQKKGQVILFNNGLHGWHLSEEMYEYHYRKVIDHMKNIYPDKKLIIVLTTPVREKNNIQNYDSVRNKIVIARNAIASKIAEEQKLQVIDLYGLVKDRPEVYGADGIHFVEEGFVLLAEKCVEEFWA